MEAAGARLKLGLVGSCGCIVRKHGHSSGAKKSKVYMVWGSMISRCLNEAHPAYPRYGGRGIGVCDRWREFESFLADMGEPAPGLTLDRKDNDKGYSRDNCRWATRTEQNRNTSSNRNVSAHGRTASIAEWAETSGLTHAAIGQRLKAGWPPERAVSQPLRGKS